MIRLEHVVKKYQSKNGEVVAVQDVSLQINKGEIFGIIGYSGAGKSSLIRLLNQLESPTSGNVTIGEKVISALKGKSLRKARQDIGMIFQHFNLLWSRTVQENIEFPLEIAGYSKKQREERSKELIRLVGLEGKESSYPSQLSGGQKQRVGIARALANNPKVLLCDEATSALDPETTNQILELLYEINQRTHVTIVLITHEMHVIQKICKRVAVMDAGRIVELGDVVQVFSHPKEDITRKFISQLLPNQLDIQAEVVKLVQQAPTSRVLQLTFLGESAEQPIITQLIQRYGVEVNILQGTLTQASGKTVGHLTIQLNGDETNVKEAIEYLNISGVETEVCEYAS